MLRPSVGGDFERKEGALKMREISRELVIQTVKELCIEANRVLPQDMKDCLAHACQIEESPLGREVLGDIVRNYETAEHLTRSFLPNWARTRMSADWRMRSMKECGRVTLMGCCAARWWETRSVGSIPTIIRRRCFICGWCQEIGFRSPLRPRGRAART